MGVRVNMDGVPKKLRAICNDPRAGSAASIETARLMDKYVPMRTGALAGSADASTPFLVKYSMPYAKRMYYGDGFNFSKEMHPNARSHWEKGLDGSDMETLARKISEAIKEL